MEDQKTSEDNHIGFKKYPFKRKLINYLIYPRFQITLTLFNLFIILGSLGVILYQVHQSFWVIENLMEAMNIAKGGETYKMINLHKDFILDSIWTATILSTVFVVVFAVVNSHKYAGPIYRLKQYLNDVVENGRLKDLNFRDGDMYSELPEVVNAALDRVAADSTSAKD